MYEPTQNDNVDSGLRKLHWITFVNYWIGFAFFLSHGILTAQILPALGLIPMTLSVSLACYRLLMLHKKSTTYQILLGDENEPRKNFDHLFAFADLATVVGDLLIFIFTCIFSFRAQRWYWTRNSLMVLAAYGSVTLLVDIGVHGYLFGKAMYTMSSKMRHDCAAHCPNCRVAREAVGNTGERYRDMAETVAPREGGTTAAQ